jgi:integrase
MNSAVVVQETASPYLQRIPRRGPMLFDQLVALYLNTHLAGRASYQTARRTIRQHFGHWQGRPITAITKLEILEWHRDIGRRTPTHANSCLKILRSMFNRAIELDLCTVNPTKGVKCFPRPSRTRFAQPTELPRLLWAITTASARDRAFFLMCLLTGARRGEVRMMRWSHVDEVNRLWHKPTTKSGRPHCVPLPEQVVEVLSLLPRKSPWVFPGAPGAGRGGRAIHI